MLRFCVSHFCKVGEVRMNPWRLRPITDKQKECIDEMQEYSPYPLPKFEGQTRGEAADYIDKYGKLAHESEWAIEHGYN